MGSGLRTNQVGQSSNVVRYSRRLKVKVANDSGQKREPNGRDRHIDADTARCIC